MPWCPECHTEYDEPSVIECANCHLPLVEEPPAQPPPRDLGEPVLLITLDGHLEAEMLLGLLAEHQIPAFKKSRDAGAYFPIAIGTNALGVGICVPQGMLEQAQELADSLFPPEGWEEITE